MDSLNSSKKSASSKQEDELSAQFQQLYSEKENFDHRRSFAMKCQIFQLERQCSLLQKSLSHRASSVVDSETEILRITQFFQNLLLQTPAGCDVTIPRSEVAKRVQTLRKLQGSLRKHQDLSHGGEGLEVPLAPLPAFSKTPLTCLDVCNSNLKSLNLEKVAQLEEDLNKLRQQLLKLQTNLKSTCTKTESSEKFLLSPTFKRISSITDQCNKELEECCEKLLHLSLLHPNAPWKVMKKPKSFGLFDPNQIIEKTFSGEKQVSKAKMTVRNMCKAHSYLMNISKLEVSAISEEVAICRQMNYQQIHFINSLLSAVCDAYKECESDLKKIVVGPIREIFDAWILMKQRQSDNTLKHFLETFTRNEARLSHLLPAQISNDVDELDPLKEFGDKFYRDLRRLQQECDERRKRNFQSIHDFRNHNEPVILDVMKVLTI